MTAARPAPLVLTAVAGQAVVYVLSILVARRLGVGGFDAYVVASAIFILLASLAPLGLEKYTLRRLPVLLRDGDWGVARALLRYGARRTLATALVAAGIVGGWAWVARGDAPATRDAVLVTCLSLPAGALVHYAVEAITAIGQAARALLIARLVVPGLALMVTLALFATGMPVTGAMVVGAWGLAWIAGLALGRRAFVTYAPGALLAAAPGAPDAAWAAAARPFFVYRVALALLGQSGIVALDLLGTDPVATGAYAAATLTTGLATVLATSTNRAYARDMALLTGSGDGDALRRLWTARLRWLGPVLGVFLGAALLFPGALLGLFRAEFAEVGATPLRLLASVTAFTVLFALAPTWLKFRARNRVTYGAVAAASGAQLLLLWLLVPRYGATGAAVAYAVTTGGMYAVFAGSAWRDVVKLSRKSA